jgi:hypothetical protein
MGHTADPDELFEVSGDELRPVVRDDPRPRVGIPLARPLHDHLDVRLGHALANLPVDDEPAVAIEEGAEVGVHAGDVDVRDVDVPAFVRFRRLIEALSSEGWLAVVMLRQSGAIERTVDARGADGDDVLVEHHEGGP